MELHTEMVFSLIFLLEFRTNEKWFFFCVLFPVGDADHHNIKISKTESIAQKIQSDFFGRLRGFHFEEFVELFSRRGDFKHFWIKRLNIQF